MNPAFNTLITPAGKIADLVSSNAYILLLLEHLKIGIPVNDKTVDTICREYHLNIELFLTLANLYNGIEYQPHKPLSYHDVIPLISFLKNSHDLYSEEIYPDILDAISKIARLNDHKEMSMVQRFFIDYYKEVSEHLEYEDKVVFPYVLELYEQLKNNNQRSEATRYSVQEYKEHHSDIEEKLNDLKSLLIKYLPIKNDRAVRRKLLFLLSELEYDLNIHSEVEDLILIPLVSGMEKQLSTAR